MIQEKLEEVIGNTIVVALYLAWIVLVAICLFYFWYILIPLAIIVAIVYSVFTT